MVSEERISDYLYAIDAQMNLRAYDAWRVAYGRGLVSAGELSRYLRRVEEHPFSWKGMLRWAIGRGAAPDYGDEALRAFGAIGPDEVTR